MNEQITLISKKTEGNGFSITETEIKKTVYCDEKSVGQKEFFSAEAKGIKAEYMVEVWSFEYNGSTVAEYKGNLYTVYRTFKKDDRLELYLGRTI